MENIYFGLTKIIQPDPEGHGKELFFHIYIYFLFMHTYVILEIRMWLKIIKGNFGFSYKR